MRRALLLVSWAAGLPLAAQAPSPRPTPPPLRSPQVQADRRVTFRLRAPNAKEVLIAREGGGRLALQKDEQDVWSVSTDPLEPDLYGYRFIVDGVPMLDPSNALIKPNLLNPSSIVHVPGPASLPWEVNDVPHGIVHHHHYKSALVGDERDFFVYTPPGYAPASAKSYPVLYLLHGMSDGADAWPSALGRANVILDNLIARGQAKPMLVVMPLGYGAPEILLTGPPGSPRPPGLRERNISKFKDALLEEVIPEVERTYRAAKDRSSRAIAGLSMGGQESLYVGLNSIDRFAWIGAFSSALPDDFGAAFPALDAKAGAKLRLLWFACGSDDNLVNVNRKLDDWLTSREIRHSYVETPGAHVWPLWRRNLAAFAPQLFR